MNKLLLAFALICFLPVGYASAQSTGNAPPPGERVYAVLSLVGDKLEVVGTQEQIGSNLDPTKKQVLAVDDAALDNAIISAVGVAINSFQRNTKVSQLNTRSKVLFEKHETLFAENNGVVSMPGAIKDALVAQQATHLVLVTKNRQWPVGELARVISTTGRLEGLGFVVDNKSNTRALNTGSIFRGYLAPYLYAKIALVDVATGKLIASEKITVSKALIGAEAKRTDGMLWNVMTTQEKLAALSTLISDEMTRVIPMMLKAS
jgi:hypothetical protein